MDWLREHADKHLSKHLRHPGHADTPNGSCQGAGASWSPNKPPYDINLPGPYPVRWSEEDKTAQRQAGEALRQLHMPMAAEIHLPGCLQTHLNVIRALCGGSVTMPS